MKQIDIIRKIRPSSSTVADILDAMGIDGTLPVEIQSVNVKSYYFVGYAYTVQWIQARKTHDILAKQDSTWNQVKNFLVPEITDGKDKIYVAGAGPLLTTAAMAGGLSSTYFAHLGFEGVILGGAVRDLHELHSLEMPILATNASPTDTQGCYRVLETGKTCQVSNKLIRSGDVIIADETGTVVIPIEMANEVIERAEGIERAEKIILEAVKNGKKLIDLIAEHGRI